MLAALLDRFEDDPVARRLALQVMLPGIKSLIDGLRGWDIDERAARVVATALEVLAHCAVEPAGTPPNFRVFANTRRRVLRAAIRDRSEPVVLVDDFSYLEAHGEPDAANRDDEGLEELIAWVRERGRLRDETARLVVLTRAGGVSVDELAAATDEAEWRVLAGSWWLRRRLKAWAAEDPRLAFEDGHRLVAAAQRRDVSSWAERDRVLAALLDRFDDDPVARRVALQVVLPEVKSLIDGLRGWDVEERAARVVATAVEVLAHCAGHSAGTPPSFRVIANTRRRALRAAIRDRSEPVVLVDDFSRFEDAPGSEPSVGGEGQRLEELVDWVRQRVRLHEDAARLVVRTRAGGVSIDEQAAVREVDPQTLRQQRLRRSLSVAR